MKSLMRCASTTGITRDPVLFATVAVGDGDRLAREVREVMLLNLFRAGGMVLKTSFFVLQVNASFVPSGAII